MGHTGRKPDRRWQHQRRLQRWRRWRRPPQRRRQRWQRGLTWTGGGASDCPSSSARFFCRSSSSRWLCSISFAIICRSVAMVAAAAVATLGVLGQAREGRRRVAAAVALPVAVAAVVAARHARQPSRPRDTRRRRRGGRRLSRSRGEAVCLPGARRPDVRRLSRHTLTSLKAPYCTRPSAPTAGRFRGGGTGRSAPIRSIPEVAIWVRGHDNANGGTVQAHERSRASLGFSDGRPSPVRGGGGGGGSGSQLTPCPETTLPPPGGVTRGSNSNLE